MQCDRSSIHYAFVCHVQVLCVFWNCTVRRAFGVQSMTHMFSPHYFSTNNSHLQKARLMFTFITFITQNPDRTLWITEWLLPKKEVCGPESVPYSLAEFWDFHININHENPSLFAEICSFLIQNRHVDQIIFWGEVLSMTANVSWIKHFWSTWWHRHCEQRAIYQGLLNY